MNSLFKSILTVLVITFIFIGCEKELSIDKNILGEYCVIDLFKDGTITCDGFSTTIEADSLQQFEYRISKIRDNLSIKNVGFNVVGNKIEIPHQSIRDTVGFLLGIGGHLFYSEAVEGKGEISNNDIKLTIYSSQGDSAINRVQTLILNRTSSLARNGQYGSGNSFLNLNSNQPHLNINFDLEGLGPNKFKGEITILLKEGCEIVIPRTEFKNEYTNELTEVRGILNQIETNICGILEFSSNFYCST